MTSQKIITQFAPNEFLFKEGEAGDRAYIIESGSVEISVQKSNRKLVMAILSEGDLVGEMAIIDQLPRTASAMAITETHVIGLPFDYINQKIEFCDPTVKLFLLVILQRYRGVHARLLHVFEGINKMTDDDNPQLQSTSNAIKELMHQYIGMQERILTAVNPTADIEEKRSADEKITRSARQLLSVEQNLRDGLANGEFKLFFQPIVDIISGEIVGCESLIRWLHPTKGLIPPMEFIPQAESTGLIVDLGYWIAETACLFQQRLKLQHKKPLFVSINLSGKQFEDKHLISNLIDIMGKYDINPSLIKYEITETLLMANPELANELLLKLKESGAKLAIDDFGTGYSSFSYLHQFPFDTLKIDRAFVSTMMQNAKSKKIVKSLVNLSHDLGMNVVAEGIETNFEAELLREQGADYGQGFFYSRPVDGTAFMALLEKAIS